MAASERLLRHLLLDPGYWQPRLERLAEEPRKLVQTPRHDLERPGTEVVELELRAHDGALLRGLLARSTFHRSGGAVHLRLCGDLATSAVDWRAVEEGATDLVFHYPPRRRLVDRVLDVVRLTAAACSIEDVDCSRIEYRTGKTTRPDEFVIADLFRSKGWI